MTHREAHWIHTSALACVGNVSPYMVKWMTRLISISTFEKIKLTALVHRIFFT